MATALAAPTALRAGAGVRALVALAATLVAFWPVLFELAALWWDSDRSYSHGLLVGPIAIWLAIRACVDARFDPAAPSVIGLVLFAGATALWVAGYLVDVLFVLEMLFPVLLVLAVATVAGWRMAARVSFPVGFLYFAIPFWTAFTPALQGVTVYVVGSLLDFFAIPLLVQGNLITIPAGVFEIADGCAGLHFFVVALTLASLRGYLALDSWRARMALIGVAAALALVTNWVRVGSLIVIGHVSDMQHYLITHEHYWYGWVLFALALVPLFTFAQWQARGSEPPEEPRSAAAAPSASRWRYAPALIGVMFVLVLALPLIATAPERDESSGDFPLALPTGSDVWQSAARGGESDWVPVYVGADSQALGAYWRGDERVDAYVAFYSSGSQGRELIGSSNRLYGEGWRLQATGRAAVDGLPGLHEVRDQVVLSPGGSPRVVWSWYAVNDRLVAADVAAKLWQAAGRLWGTEAGAVIAISTPCAADCDGARDRLRDFVQALGMPLVGTANPTALPLTHGLRGEDPL